MVIMVQSFAGSLVLVLHTTLILMRGQELCSRTKTMEDAYEVKITLQLCTLMLVNNRLVILILVHLWHFA